MTCWSARRTPPRWWTCSRAESTFTPRWICVWITKKLLRGEVWVARDDCDGYLKGLLLEMIGCHAVVTGKAAAPTRRHGRYLERWAHSGLRARLQGTFGGYDRVTVARALIATMDLFRDLATETAASLGIPFPSGEDGTVRSWVEQQLRDTVS